MLLKSYLSKIYEYNLWHTIFFHKKSLQIIDLKTLSDPAGIRTQDPYIKSVLLYQLSYGIIKPKFVYNKMCQLTRKESYH